MPPKKENDEEKKDKKISPVRTIIGIIIIVILIVIAAIATACMMYYTYRSKNEDSVIYTMVHESIEGLTDKQKKKIPAWMLNEEDRIGAP